MRPDDVLRRIGDNLSVRRVFGEPVERDGIVVVPVAMVVGGGGGGVDDGGPSAPTATGGTARSVPTDRGARNGGGGFGMFARGVGVYVIRAGEVRFVPATDRTLLAGLGMLIAARVLTRALARRRD